MESDANMEISNGENKQEFCPVCLESPVTETTKCQHKFCCPCLNAWLAENSSCPLCRSELNSLNKEQDNYMYNYPFAIEPLDFTPSGSMNFSRIDTYINLRAVSEPAVEPVARFGRNNISAVVRPYPEEFRGAPYIQVHIPSISTS
jgi:hypothetical protein